MKSLIIFFSLLCGALAEDKESPALELKDNGTLTFTASAESSTITARYLVIVQSANSEPIIRIGELPYERIINPSQPISGSSFYFATNPYHYIRPQKPEELKIELWTADGKKWVPQWVEVKQ